MVAPRERDALAEKDVEGFAVPDKDEKRDVRDGDAGLGAEVDEDEDLREADRLLQESGAMDEQRGSVSSTGSGGGAAEGSKRAIPAYIIIPIWISISGGVILLNKHIFTTLNFPYPVFMTAYHMVIATVGTRILQLLPFDRLRPRPINMSWLVFCQTILPLGALFSVSLILSNMAYVHLSVSFVQMLKAFIPILTLVIQLFCGLQEFSHFLLAIVAVTAGGCIIAAAGELRFSLFGFLCQATAVVTESIRLVLIQVVLRHHKLDPLSSIAMYAPICVVLISVCLTFTEGLEPLRHLDRVGLPLFALNGLVAFALNVVGMFLIDSAGSLVLTLSGVLKDVLLITVAVALGSPITPMQIIGYTIVLSGLLMYRLTGGSASSPVGQRVVRVLQSGLDTPRAIAARAPRAHVRIVGLVLLVSAVGAMSWWLLGVYAAAPSTVHGPGSGSGSGWGLGGVGLWPAPATAPGR